MNRLIALALLAVLALGLGSGCGPQKPPVQTMPASRRFLKTSTEAPAEKPER